MENVRKSREAFLNVAERMEAISSPVKTVFIQILPASYFERSKYSADNEEK